MSISIFYAWQLDRDKKICRSLIRAAAQAALKKLRTDADIKSAPAFDLDEATKGVPGHPHIAATIRKKIAACGMFLADLTHAAEYVTADGRKKYAQNGNVLIELGIAIRAKGFGRLILVMNDAFGGPEELPFDLKSHSYPITYTLADASDSARVEDAKKELTKAIADKLKPMMHNIANAKAEGARQSAVAEEAVRRQHAQERWKEFDVRFTQGDFRGMATPKLLTVIGPGVPRDPREVFLTWSIVAIDPLPQPLDLRAIRNKYGKDLRPMGASGWNSELYGRALVFHDGRGQRGNGAAESPNSVTELTDDGCIFAATSMGVSTRDNDDVIALQRAEVDVLHSLPEYAHVLRDLGIRGPLEVRITLIGVDGAFVQPPHSFNWDSRNFRQLTQDKIPLEPIMITEDMDSRAVAAAMRRVFTFVWRDAGLPDDPCFDGSGNVLAS